MHRGSLSTFPLPPLLIVRRVAERQVILAVSNEAHASGIRRGMTLTQARALRADVEHADHEPQRDRRTMEALGRWLMRFSPVVACSMGAEPEEGSDEQDAPAIFLDVTGSERLFAMDVICGAGFQPALIRGRLEARTTKPSGIENLVAQVSAAMRRLGIGARVAVAPTPGAAWALADEGKKGAIVPADKIAEALAPLSPASLRIGREMTVALHHLGLTTIGQVMALPRSALPARFGTQLLTRLDQALGRIPEPLTPLEHQATIAAQMDFDGVVSSLEAVWAVFQHLIGQLITQLTRRGCGARRLEVELLRPHALPLHHRILLSRPSRDARNLFNLFRCALEGSGFRVRGSVKTGKPSSLNPEPRTLNPPSNPHLLDDGFVGMRLTASLHEPLSDEQISLLAHEEYAGRMELDRLLERLAIRLGEGAIVRPQPAESHVPEKAWAGGPGTCITARSSVSASVSIAGKLTRGRGDTETRGIRPSAHLRVSASGSPKIPASASTRPLHLLPRPLELRVMVSPSDDAEGQPVAFSYEREVRRVTHAIGPERIGGQWWEGNDKTRDYFDVEETRGRRFWIFRVRQTGKWYLHGVFE